MILARELEKIYGHGPAATHALKGVDLNIQKGEFVAIMGRSGSGKSTLLHLLGLLDKPTSGYIYINDMDVLQLSEKERARFRLEKLGYVFQEYSLIGEMTVLENVYMPSICLNNSGYKKAYARELLDIVGLGHRLNLYAGEISGGEQQRVAIARALINKPGILYADEPTASLDTESAITVLQLFSKLNKDLKQTIIMVTHEPDDEVYVDRIIRLANGLIDMET
ncbi:MAG TPA: ABC transporter ATP-binding protein [Dehalococcoidia bacterium]|nr:ABC transporter ATP-binding protein [Dehalococcoidia bacterium]